MKRAAQQLASLGFRRAAADAAQARQFAKVAYVPRPGAGSGLQTVVLVPGDGIGPEVTKSVKDVVASMNAPIAWETYDDVSGTDSRGNPVEKLPTDVLAAIRKHRVCLKGTLFTPLSRTTSTQSLNVQMRKDLNLYVNMVHGFSIPGLKTRHDDLDIVVIRENIEGEYSGLEHEVVPGVVESLKVITWANSLRIAEYAFEYASLNNRKKVTAVHKANIVKKSDGLFLQACNAVAEKYPGIEYEQMIVDNTSMQLVANPQQFDVMVTPNFYGNLMANIVAGLIGGAGVCPGCNVGDDVAIFEQGARHVAKDVAGRGIANPTAMLLSTAMLLRHLGMESFSDRLENSVMAVYLSGDKSLLTPDVGGTGTLAGFTQAVIKGCEGGR